MAARRRRAAECTMKATYTRTHKDRVVANGKTKRVNSRFKNGRNYYKRVSREKSNIEIIIRELSVKIPSPCVYRSELGARRSQKRTNKGLPALQKITSCLRRDY